MCSINIYRLLYLAIYQFSLETGNFLDFGPAVGDSETSLMEDGDGVLGPITLSVPIVYYLRQETELYVS